jgi:hypothetical protein
MNIAADITEAYPDNVIWRPMPGSQEAFLASTPIFEVLFEGTRGGGKTDTLLMSFCMHVGIGYGAAWRGILFRQTYKQLEDVISKTKKWIPQIWPEAKFNNSEHVWTWPTGERLLLRQYMKPDDYWNYHGHEYPWIGWEELCNWAWYDGYKRMFSCCRSSQKGMPRMIRATTNPYGPGHNWVKMRFRLPAWNMKVIKDSKDDQGNLEPARLSIRSHIDENKALLEADPEYKQKIAASARNLAERKAWLEGSWDIVAGGMFDDVWDPKYNVVEPFDIPERWKMTRSFDWGSSAPFSVGWWAISNGEDIRMPDGKWRSTIRGDIFRVHEWYGWTGKPNEGQRVLATDITRGIIEHELKKGWRLPGEDWQRVYGGVADSQIFSAENGNCIAVDMKTRQRLDDGHRYPGVVWSEADKRPGSRVTGWDQMRRYLKRASPWVTVKDPSTGDERSIFTPREKPGLFVFSTCDQFIRTVPVLPRDEKEPDDVNTDAEDHVADETRYLVRSLGSVTTAGKTIGT